MIGRPVKYHMVGERHGRLTVVAFAPGSVRTRWLCRCDCGNEKVVDGYYLRNGMVRSCGCLRVERIRETKRLGPGMSGRNQLFLRYQNTATYQYGLPFSLSVEEFTALTGSSCHYCGAAPSRKITNLGARTKEARAHASYTFNGIDRKDNSRGYESDNCLPCCTDCNRWKGAKGYDEFLSQIKRIYFHTTWASAQRSKK